MGLLDLPAPLFVGLDAMFANVLPPLARLVLWALIAAIASMLLYGLISPQRRIAEAADGAAEARRRLARYDGDFDGLLPEVGRFLGLSLRHVCLTTGPALLASLPLLALLAWLSTAYGYAWPVEGQEIAVQVLPAGAAVTWRPADAVSDASPARLRWPKPGVGVAIADGGGAEVALVPPRALVPVLHKRQWWNLILGNPAGYLPEMSRIEEITLDLPPRNFLAFGPAWARTWELSFLLPLLAFSLAIKLIFRIR